MPTIDPPPGSPLAGELVDAAMSHAISPGQMHSDGALEDLGLVLVETQRRQRKTGVVHEHVEPRQAGRDRVDARRVLDVELHVPVAGEVSVVLAHGGSRARDVHLCPGAAIGRGDARADAARAAGDQHGGCGVVEADVGPGRGHGRSAPTFGAASGAKGSSLHGRQVCIRALMHCQNA